MRATVFRLACWLLTSRRGAAAKPYIQQAEPYVRQLWTHLEPHHRCYTGHVNTVLHGYEPWQILAIASVATMVLTKVVSRLFS